MLTYRYNETKGQCGKYQYCVHHAVCNWTSGCAIELLIGDQKVKD